MLKYDIYLIAHIGGASMSGLAEILLKQGHTVYGWERNVGGARIQYLIEHRVTIFSDQIPQAVLASIDCVVHSSVATSDDIRSMLGIPQDAAIYSQFEFIDLLIEDAVSVAITGSYGKTITTSLLSCIFDAANYDVSFTCGGIAKNYDSNAKLGTSDLWIIEAVETHGNCLRLNPTHGVVLNIEHPDQVQLFNDFIANVKQTVFVNADDSNTRQLISDTAKLITFGIENASAEYRAQNVQAVADSLQFQFYHGITLLGMVVVPKNRFFSVSNALAACVFASHWGLSIEAINRGLHRYQGVRSRFDVLYDGERHLFVKDIAHHPESIRKVMQKCREFGREQLIVIYQPHMYKELNEEASATLAALHQADMIAILDVASVKDVQEGGVDAKTFVETQQKVSNHWFYVAESHSLDVWLARLLEKPSVIVQMGMYVDRQSNAHITTNIMQVLG